MSVSEQQVQAVTQACRDRLGDPAGWVPPDEFRRLLPKVTTRKRRSSILMMAPLGARGAALIERQAPQRGALCWATEHI